MSFTKAALFAVLLLGLCVSGPLALAEEPTAPATEAPKAETSQAATPAAALMNEALKAEAARAPGAKTEAQQAAAKPTEKKAFKGLYEALQENPLRWLPEEDLFALSKPLPLAERLLTPAAKKKLIDPLFEPIFLLRLSYVTTHSYRFTDAQGVKRSSADLLRSFLGYREGFVLENLELGFKGRHNDTGVYYGGKLELVPREKDGTKEDEYLKEAFIGWNKYAMADVQAGLIKVPLGQQLQKATPDMPLVYAPLIDTLLPKRQLGAKLTLSDPYKVLSVSGGMFNTAKQPYDQLPDGKYLMYAARAELNVGNLLSAVGHGYDRFFRLQFGGSYAYTDQNFENPSTRMRFYGYDGRLDLYIFTFEGEYLEKDYFSEELGPKKARHGKAWHLDSTVHAWPGVLDATLRVEEADGNTSTHMNYAATAAEAVDQQKRWITAGLLLHLTRQLDIEFNYLHRGILEGRALTNDAFVTTLQFNL